jgi:hypothetical protein
MAASCSSRTKARHKKPKTNLLANSSPRIQSIPSGDEVDVAGYGSSSLDSHVPDLIANAMAGASWARSRWLEDHGLKNIIGAVSNRQTATTLLRAFGMGHGRLAYAPIRFYGEALKLASLGHVPENERLQRCARHHR